MHPKLLPCRIITENYGSITHHNKAFGDIIIINPYLHLNIQYILMYIP